MPELPEVETYRTYLNKTSLDQVVKKVSIRDDRVLEVDPKELKEAVEGKKFHSTQRHGKYVFVDLKGEFLILHFGMSGDLLYFEDLEEEPTHSRVLFSFEKGKYLSYISQRMFGKIYLTPSVEYFLKKKNLGPDALKMTYEDFLEALERRTAYAKTTLMNQDVIAGIGNIYSDEILFQSHIHPKTHINTLTDSQLREVFENIKKVLHYGIEKKGNLGEYSQKCLIPHRDQEDNCPRCGTQIQRLSVSSRHGFFCPNCQKA